MGAVASSCVRDCVRSSHEYAGEVAEGSAPRELLSVSVQPQNLSAGSKGSDSPAALDGNDAEATVGGVPPVPNWFQVLRRGTPRQASTETPRFDEVSQTPRLPMETPRSVAGEFKTPRPQPNDSPNEAPEEVSYEGTFLGTQKHGRGTLRMPNCTYHGEFLHDKKHGQGILTWDDGRRYSGGFEIDQFHGHAVMSWPDGRRYTGLYADDRKHGEGTFTWQDGRRYQGQWVCGKRHGIGIYTNAKGLTRRGTWQMDRPLQWENPGAEFGSLGVGNNSSGPQSARRQHILESPSELPEGGEVDLEVSQVIGPAAESCKV